MTSAKAPKSKFELVYGGFWFSHFKTKIHWPQSTRTHGPALNPMACVENLVKLHFRIGFNMGNGQIQGYYSRYIVWMEA